MPIGGSRLRFSIQVSQSEHAVQFHSVSTPRIYFRNTVKIPVNQVRRKRLRQSDSSKESYSSSGVEIPNWRA
jgi:hypothetical protein